MSLNKKKILEAFIKTQENKIQSLKNSLRATKQGAIDAPGSNVSHSDTSKFQLSNLALGLEKRVREAEEALSLLKGISENPNDTISIGSFFTLRDIKSGNYTHYFLVPQAGGEWLDIDGEEVLSISEEAPLIESVIGRRKGDKIKFRDKFLEVINLQ